MEEIILATRNQGKVAEYKELLKSVNVNVTGLDDYPDLAEPEETGKNFAANARLKATYYAQHTGKFCLADDSGLEVMSLKGEPGVYSARYAGEEATDKDNMDLLLLNMRMKTRRNCRFNCAIAVANPEGKIVAETNGTCDGMLLHAPLGEGGFGYDPIFWSTELHMGLGEATPEEKNSISHRAKAAKKIVGMWSKIK